MILCPLWVCKSWREPLEHSRRPAIAPAAKGWRLVGNIVWKVLAASSAVLAGVVASKVTDQIWRTAGQEDIDPADPESPILQAVAYAALTGLIAAAVKTFTTRKAAQYYENSAGHLPKGV